MDSIKSAYEQFGLQFPFLFLMIATAFGALPAFFGGWTALVAIREGRGVVTGRVVLQDGSDPTIAKLRFLMNGKIEKEFKPNSHGDFAETLSQGTYSLSIAADGYDQHIVDGITSVKGTNNLRELHLKVTPKPVTIKLTDKKGIPYKQLKMQLSKKDNSMDKFISQDTTNDIGIIQTNTSLDFGTYEFVLVSPTQPEASFLWFSGANNRDYTGHFQLKGTSASYNVVLPKVSYVEQSGSNSAPTLSAQNEKYFAQSFTLNKITPACGLGFGIGLGDIGTPLSLQVRTDHGGSPSNTIILEGQPKPFSGSISSGSSGSFADICKGQLHILPPGIYWMVAKFNQVPPTLSVLGGPESPINGTTIKSSVDGHVWIDSTIFTGSNIRMIDLFIVE